MLVKIDEEAKKWTKTCWFSIIVAKLFLNSSLMLDESDVTTKLTKKCFSIKCFSINNIAGIVTEFWLTVWLQYYVHHHCYKRISKDCQLWGEFPVVIFKFPLWKDGLAKTRPTGPVPPGLYIDTWLRLSDVIAMWLVYSSAEESHLCAVLTLRAHAQEGYSSPPVCIALRIHTSDALFLSESECITMNRATDGVLWWL